VKRTLPEHLGGALRFLLVLLVAGCSSVEEGISRDVVEVAELVEKHAGAQPPPHRAGTQELTRPPEVQALLAGELTEESTVKVALLNNRRVGEVYERLGIARADLLQAGLLTNPVFDANAKFFRNGTEIELGLAQSFLDLFFIPLRKRIAEAELAAAKAFVTRELVRLVYDVRRAFVNLRAAQQLVEMRHQVLAVAAASQELMARLHAAGNVTDPQLTSEVVAQARARIELAASEADVIEAREPLNVLLGLWGDGVHWKISGRLPEDATANLPLDHLESRSVAASLDLAENRAHIEAAARRAGLTSWEAIFGTGELGAVAKKESGESGFGVGPALAMTLPIFDQGQAQRGAAQARLREVLYRHAALAVEIRAAVRGKRERTRALAEQARYFLRVRLPLHARLLRETLQNYNAMQIGVFDVLLVRQQQIDAAQEYLETLRDAWMARLDLEELLAGSLNPDRDRALSQERPTHEQMSGPRRGH